MCTCVKIKEGSMHPEHSGEGGTKFALRSCCKVAPPTQRESMLFSLLCPKAV